MLFGVTAAATVPDTVCPSIVVVMPSAMVYADTATLLAKLTPLLLMSA